LVLDLSNHDLRHDNDHWHRLKKSGYQ
jgi:hypothetical protein